MKKLFFVITTMAIVTLGAQTFVVDTSLSIAQLVNQKLLLGSGITASNITYTGHIKSFGFFKTINKPNPWPANKDSLGLDSGLFLTSGVYDNLGSGLLPSGQSVFNGPANNFQSFQSLGGSSTGDIDLTALAGNSTQDAAVLEFDFVPLGNLIEIRFVFASEEYNDYVNSINDIFGIFVNGVSLTLAKTNIAKIPNTNLPVTINSVNNGSSSNGTAAIGPCLNCAFYRDNWNSMINGVYDGYTAPIIASLNVLSGQTYHLKIAIADVSDHIFDSGLFFDVVKASGTNIVDYKLYESELIFKQDEQNKSISIYSNLKDNHTYFRVVNSISGEMSGAYMQNKELKFDLSHYSSGVYAIVYNQNGKMYSKKFLLF
jgi:hypothetical protein